jgi:hypothetical protein
MEKNKQRRDWLNWYGKTMNLMDLTAQANKALIKTKNPQYNWAERYKAKAFGFNIGPELVGDSMYLSGLITDDFGNMVKP